MTTPTQSDWATLAKCGITPDNLTVDGSLYMRGEMSDNAGHRVASDLDAAYANFNHDRFISAAIPD